MSGINASVTFDANCSVYTSDKEAFKGSFSASIVNAVGLRPDQVKVSNVQCGKLLIYQIYFLFSQRRRRGHTLILTFVFQYFTSLWCCV